MSRRRRCQPSALAPLLALVLFAMGEGPAAPQDAAAPTVSILTPAADEVVAGTRRWRLLALDEDGGSGVDKVVFLVDGVEVAVDADGGDGFDLDWSSLYFADGPRALTARTTDRAGNARTSAAVSVTVDNRGARLDRIERPQDRAAGVVAVPADRIPPQARLLAPLPGQATRLQVALRAWAADDSGGSGIRQVLFLIDGVPVGQGVAAGDIYTLDWQSAGYFGQHNVTALAFDNAGFAAYSQAVSFVVDNVQPRLDAAAGFTPRVEPAEINTGQVLVTLYFDGTGSEMDPTVAPTVTYQAAAPAGGGAAPAAVALPRVAYTGRMYLGTAQITAATNPGRVRISVTGARDRAGNEMAAANRIADFDVVRIGQWPIPNVALAHRIWDPYGGPIRNGVQGEESFPFYLHEGIDLDALAGTEVRAVEAGQVSEATSGPAGGYFNVVSITCTDPAHPRHSFGYLHMTIGKSPRTGAKWAVGNDIRANETIGTVIKKPHSAMLAHAHLELLDRALPGNAPTSHGDPMRLLDPVADAVAPGVAAGFEFRYAEHQSLPGATYFPHPGGGGAVTIDGNTDFVVRASDDFGAFPRDLSVHRIAWELADRFDRPVVPYTVFENMDDRYFDAAGTYDSQRQGARARVVYEFSPQHQSTSGADNAFADDGVYWYTLTNQDEDDQLETTDVDRSFNSNTRRGQGWNAFDGAGLSSRVLRVAFEQGAAAAGALPAEPIFPDARLNREAAFPDGAGYRLTVRAVDEQGNEGTRTEAFDIDNFTPFVERLLVRQPAGRRNRNERYDAAWTLPAAAAAQNLVPAAAADRNPLWINGREEAEVVLQLSEPVTGPALRVDGGAGGQTAIPLAAVAGGEGRLFRGALTKAQLASHALDGDTSTLRVEAADAAGNRLDSNPATPAARNAARAFVNHEAGADTQHRLRIDTRAPERAVPERPRPP